MIAEVESVRTFGGKHFKFSRVVMFDADTTST